LEMRSWEPFAQAWPRTLTLPISASQVAKIIGVSHRCWLSLSLFFNLCLCVCSTWSSGSKKTLTILLAGSLQR
jgi:hypothetical protein